MRPTAGFTFQVFDGGGMKREIRQIDIFFKSPQNANKIIKKAGDRVFGHNQNSNLEYLSTDFKKNWILSSFRFGPVERKLCYLFNFGLWEALENTKKNQKSGNGYDTICTSCRCELSNYKIGQVDTFTSQSQNHW